MNMIFWNKKKICVYLVDEFSVEFSKQNLKIFKTLGVSLHIKKCDFSKDLDLGDNNSKKYVRKVYITEQKYKGNSNNTDVFALIQGDEIYLFCKILSIPSYSEKYKKTNDLLYVRRIQLLLLQSIGFSYGLNYCKDQTCVMSYAGRFYEWDEKMPEFCESCNEKLKINIKNNYILTDETKIYSNERDFNFNIGYNFYCEKNYCEATKHFEKSRQIDNNDIVSQMYLAHSYYYAKQYSEAIKEYKNVVEKEPYYYSEHFHLAYAYEKVGNLEYAIREYKNFFELFPGDFKSHNNLGAIYLFKMNLLEDAINEFQTAVKLDSKDKYAYTNLGIAYEKLGDMNSAVKYWKKAIAVAPDCKWTEKAREGIKKFETIYNNKIIN